MNRIENYDFSKMLLLLGGPMTANEKKSKILWIIGHLLFAQLHTNNLAMMEMNIDIIFLRQFAAYPFVNNHKIYIYSKFGFFSFSVILFNDSFGNRRCEFHIVNAIPSTL